MAEAVPFSLPSTQEVRRGVEGAVAGDNQGWERTPLSVSRLPASTVSSPSIRWRADGETPSHSGPSRENCPD